MRTVEILRAAAEDVQRGLWCTGSWLVHPNYYVTGFTTTEGDIGEAELLPLLDTGRSAEITEKAGWLRCAEGSILFATAVLGGSSTDYHSAVAAVESRLHELCDQSCKRGGPYGRDLYDHNDGCLADSSPVEAGKSLAKLFNQVADLVEEEGS